MGDKAMNYPPMPAEKLQKLRDYYENGTSVAGIPDKVKAHLARVKEMGGGQGIEFLSNINKDYLGAFMAPFSRDVENADIVIVGEPLEKSAPMNASHKYGPKVIREISKNFMGTTEPWLDGDFDVPFDECRIIDYGNIDTYGQFDLSGEVEHIMEHYDKIVNEAGCAVLSLGGDHTASYPPLRALGKRHGPLGVIHIDAHYDLVTFADFPYPYHSGAMFSRNYADGYVDPERHIQIGIRGRMTGLVGGHAANFGTTVYSADEARAMTAKDMAQRIIEVVGDGPTYITVDLDGLDAVYNSASSAVEPFGLEAGWLWDVFREVRASGKVNLVGADIMEYAPQNDPVRTFGYYAAAFGWKLLCWLAADVARRNGERRGTVWQQAFGNVTL
ncbi:MAG: arginase family protein [Hyphomicrobiaceae bacterium]